MNKLFKIAISEPTFLRRTSSLEGEFDLYRFALPEIGSNDILTRILNFRI